MKLTLEHAKEKDFRVIDCVKFFRPEWTDEQCKDYLWNKTCFPFDMEVMISQLNNQLGEKDEQ